MGQARHNLPYRCNSCKPGSTSGAFQGNELSWIPQRNKSEDVIRGEEKENDSFHFLRVISVISHPEQVPDPLQRPVDDVQVHQLQQHLPQCWRHSLHLPLRLLEVRGQDERAAMRLGIKKAVHRVSLVVSVFQSIDLT
ncbi:hypothetical protein SFRURICE_007151 [Spodoptera frugiperda]|nr:hypothetical protein SFRURICE_007151 [Spodoptera frugiperda]